ncbi:unnamed protein product (macronuclear) [Paramecium tetraurelia]|uniref:MORN repeat protein n=1 Tax=Paramecium tetraurelia TaxID=5888 RepID=A0CM62_PARTE|nr:uncharacterized protein GSPATT00008358001 [Paramecium tetraurelia]CAK71879.1 unnamed protein product [Paramecium tetraurelia]|eukprot:XP_001439276.1 hypothetical protein (macronuclear) [Paramecium tetraurelia strain d4-2]
MKNQEISAYAGKLSQIYQNDSISHSQNIQLANDEISQSLANSPSMNTNLQVVLKKLQSKKIRQLYQELGPVYDIDENYEIRNFDDDSCYFGQVENDQKNGTGILVWSEVGNILDGIWVNNELNGFCRMIYSNGDMQSGNQLNSFECEFKYGKANGFGVFSTKSKVVKGLWTNNVLNGEGQEIRSDGSKYFGQFKDGQKNGKGIIYYKDGCKYEGEISKNKLDGKGVLVWNDSSYYEGEFRSGIINGSGIYVSGNGNSLSGYFEEISNKDRIQRIQCIHNSGSERFIEKIRYL